MKMWSLTGLLLCLGVIGIFAVPIQKDDKPKTHYLLNDAVRPDYYNILLDVSKSFAVQPPKKFQGKVEISATVLSDTENITLHAYDMSIIDITVLNNHANISKDYKLEEERQFLFISLTKELKKDEKINIIIKYNGNLQNNMHGFYVSSYNITKTTTTEPEYLLTTQFQPTHARKAFPCFDEPRFKATFKISFKIPVNYGVISNMPKTANSTALGVEFETTNRMSTYLVAFIVSKFDFKPNTNNDFKVWARPDAIEQTETAVEYMPKIVDSLDKFTGIKYSSYVKKMDMAAIPDFSAGAMENWGLLTYRETALLVDKTVSTNRDIQRVVTVISHEIAHQWFGNLVTLTWWDNTWLNEGFARYFEYHTTQTVTDNWEMNEQFVVDQQQSVFEVDALAKSTPLTYEVYTPEEISFHFGSISYSKGGSVIRMMEHFMGTNEFREGLRDYLNSNKLKNTKPEHLWTSLQSKVDLGKNLKLADIMNTWIKQAGYPVIDVTVTDKKVTFAQKKFFLNPDENKKDDTSAWYVPISYFYFGNETKSTKPKLWLTPTTKTASIDLGTKDWFIVNVDETGYYRVNYNKEHWKKLTNVLLSDKRDQIGRLNRAQLVDDALNFARAGIMDYTDAFGVSDFLAKEKDYYPWQSAFRAFRFLLQRYSENDDAGKELRLYMLKLMETLIKEKTLKSNLSKEKQTDVFNTVNALEWACNLGHTKCVNDAEELFKNLTGIDKNLKSVVYCTAIKTGPKKNWDTLWTKYTESKVAAEKVNIINALGCTKDKITLENYLSMSINEIKIRDQDASYVFSAVYTGSTEGVDAALEFLKKYPEQIKERYGGMNALDNAALGLGGRLTSDAQIKKFTEILKNKIFDNIRNAATETVQQNQKWAKNYAENIANILKKKRNSAVSILINNYVLALALGFITIYFNKFC